MAPGISHRSYVSYIDKSREYYRASGYDRPYRWAHYKDVPFSRLTKPLSRSRIGVVTTADQAPSGAPRATKLFAAPNGESGRLFTEKSWDREATHTDDPETYLPLARLAEHVEAGHVGSLSPRFYGVPTDYSQRLTLEQDAPRIEAWMREDGVDIALLVPL
jgi:D-proline reductase (dithiol) PrdB